MKLQLSEKSSDLEKLKLITTLSRDGINVTDRKIYLPEVELELPLVLNSYIEQINSLSEPSKINDPIELVISSLGGSIYGMLGTVDVIRSCSVKINTTVTGAGMSAGAWIAGAGTGIRRMHKHSYLMIHQLRGGQSGTMSEMDTTTLHLRKIQKRAEQLLAQFSNKDEKYWRVACKKDFYIDAQKAKDLGLVDEIISW